MKFLPVVLATILLCLVVGRVVMGSHGTGTERRLIAVVPMATTDEYWKSIHAGAVKAGRECDVDLLWQGPLTYDRNTQLNIIENMINRRVTGMVLAPIDRNAARAAVENCVRSGIPVIVIDSDLNSTRQISFIATDNYKGGYLAGKHLAELVHKNGKVVLLRGSAGNASVDNRERGFLDAIKEYPHLTLLSSNQRIGASYEESYKSAENLLNRFRSKDGSQIDGIFCPNESATFVMLRAMQDSGVAGKIRFVGFDSSRKLNDALYKGQIDCLVVQNPMKMGYLGVKHLVAYLRGEKVEPRVDTGVTLATPENMHDPQVQELLEPKLKEWLH